MSSINDAGISTYLGSKGYSIMKDAISLKEQKYIRDALNVKPYIPNSIIKPNAFPIYRESKQKFYVPRYWGIETYGLPDEIRINKGNDIDITFNGNLRDYQKEIVDIYLKSTEGVNGGGGLLEIDVGMGKTVMALNIISKLKKKTLVIVHKSFLMNQWVERIKQFLPDAKIGKIQGKILDIDGKDIVIGMLQSLSMKEYPQEIYDEFGLTIIDECHHISSEVFSRSLKRIVTYYALGLSATMQRKDGLTKVFKMFLGEVVCKKKRKGDEFVLVKGIDYYINDDEFNEVKYDFRGNPAYSSMITKLCKYNRRSDFIIKIIKKELEIKKDQQIMILGQNKSILKYLYDAISYHNISSVGYYVGGMKEEALKESENKTIIIATYAMASEGLDIKTLTTLILVTPRTDVTQSIGRILRVKHERPLVIDIIDHHDLFKKQWNKRKLFYKKCNYKIIHTNNNLYNEQKYEVLFDPLNKLNVKKKTKKKTCFITDL